MASDLMSEINWISTGPKSPPPLRHLASGVDRVDAAVLRKKQVLKGRAILWTIAARVAAREGPGQ
eukprot:5638838-Pyramimonas_sp.AAC.1